ncbi:MAG: SRPBCC family protein [Rhizobium sp.]|nr:SRPBCC family protein [Rhizobium sp.]MBX9455571.1 SRPBCC family protein [Rhizobium sp.]
MTDPVVRTELLIRAPIERVFEAFVDPDITARFWFSRGTTRLAEGTELEWHWEMYGASTLVKVLAIESNRLIRIDWDIENEPTRVEWRFSEFKPGQTWVEIENYGFAGDSEKKMVSALDATGGFALVLAGAKIWLEHGIEPDFVLDRHPHARAEAWKEK